MDGGLELTKSDKNRQFKDGELSQKLLLVIDPVASGMSAGGAVD